MHYDVLICGAGPAGSTCGRLLARQGLKVAIFDRARFPRYKPCGGGLTGKAQGELEAGWEDLIEDTTREVIFYHRQERPLKITCEQPAIKMVSREKFDSWLLTEAARAGAEVRDGYRVTGVTETAGGVKVQGQDGCTWEGRFLVGADGALSLVRRSLPFKPGGTAGITLECEVPVDAGLLTSYRGQVHLSYGGIPYGYGWVFPKGDHLSVGIGSFTRRVKGLRRYFDTFCRGLGLAVPANLRCRGAVIPAADGQAGVFHTGRALLVGDAAGLVDPFSGEGIYYALRSGRLAAETIMATLAGTGEPGAYSRRLYDELLQPLHYARRIARVVYALTPVVHRLVTANPGIARRLVEVLFGRDTYPDLWQYLTRRYAIFRLAR
ncbi:geranylgeranyl reductase family protein [Neomoorella thermoacetica]|uniref:geranylgeranyl reductase family protein n=1 Tax=Neomoorella thermoacetica TaxID=1525 RepID=UPI0008FB7136|nr:geranylgeranyl reductase family protein [Moorella thermoacetica]OIQ55668.1 putative oxidoreductasec [Moorella thermoacetica]